MTNLTPLSPKQTFEDNMRPAQLLLRVYRLLDSDDHIQTEGDMVTSLRELTNAAADEDVMLIYTDLFLGLVRERADIKRSSLMKRSLCHLLRQAVVASCTAVDTYLPALLRTNLPVRIRALKRSFINPGDKDIKEQFKALTFDLDETLRLSELEELPRAEFIADKMLRQINVSYLGHKRGISVTGTLLGVEKPWSAIANHLQQEEKVVSNLFQQAMERRNDIVHRADRAQKDPTGDPQEMTYPWAKQAVDTVEHVCLTLDELVSEQIKELESLIAS